MSAIINRYHHVFSTWEVYPRVHYFQRRFIDLHRRLKTLTGAFPSTYNDPNVLEDIDKLQYMLVKPLTVTVYGKEDLSPSEFAVSEDEEDDKPANGISVLICHAHINENDENSIQDVEDVLNQAAKTLEFKPGCQDIICYCDIRPDSSESGIRDALLHASARVNGAHGFKGLAPENIMLGKNAHTLQSKISELLESRIVDGLLKISSYLQRFVKVDRLYDQEQLGILDTQSCIKAVQDFLGNGHRLYDMRRIAENEEDFLDQVIDTLSSIIRCAVVPTMAAKHNLQLWMCNKLLQEIKFEKCLGEKVSQNTRYHLSKLEKNYFEVYKTSSTHSSPMRDRQTKSHDFDFLVYHLQTYIFSRYSHKRGEKTFRYAIFYKCNEKDDVRDKRLHASISCTITVSGNFQYFSSPEIADQLREKVLALEGVYGIGTLFGQLEIHLEQSNADDMFDRREKIIEVINDCQFQHPFVIKEVKMKPKSMAKDFYEQGDTLSCPLTNDYNTFRKGTLGCFVKGRDNKHYGLTCAHVVHPDPNSKMNVMIEKRGQNYKRFGKSKGTLCVRPSEGSLKSIDIAAVLVYANVTNDCNLSMKDDNGRIKPARIVNKTRKELAECFVFKSGATTGITKGIIASADYNIAVDKVPEHLVLIEPLPADDEKDLEEKALELANSDIGNSSQASSPLKQSAERQQTMLADASHCMVDSLQNAPSKLREREPKQLRSVASGIKDPQFGAGACGLSCEMSFSDINEFRDENAFDVSQNSSTVFAEEGDSGSVVCMIDLDSKSVSVISMVSYGDLQLKGYGLDALENKMCVSFILAEGLKQLGIKYNKDPDFFKFE